MLTLTGSISIEPAPVPLNLKVVLLAEPEIYYEILEVEPELDSILKSVQILLIHYNVMTLTNRLTCSSLQIMYRQTSYYP